MFVFVYFGEMVFQSLPLPARLTLLTHAHVFCAVHPFRPLALQRFPEFPGGKLFIFGNDIDKNLGKIEFFPLTKMNIRCTWKTCTRTVSARAVLHTDADTNDCSLASRCVAVLSRQFIVGPFSATV